jgi:hypothetical protein
MATATTLERSLSRGYNVPARGRPDHSSEYFLKDHTIGPLTGLTKIFADLHLNKEPYKLPAHLQKKVFYGMAGVYVLRVEEELLAELVADPRKPLTGDEIWNDLEKTIIDPQRNGAHRFEVLTKDHRAIGRMRSRIEDDLAMILRPKRGMEYHEAVEGAVGRGADFKRERAEVLYHILRNALGLELSDANWEGIALWSERLKKFPNRTRFKHYGHTGAVLHYLEDEGPDGRTGLQVLKDQLSIRHGMKQVGKNLSRIATERLTSDGLRHPIDHLYSIGRDLQSVGKDTSLEHWKTHWCSLEDRQPGKLYRPIMSYANEIKISGGLLAVGFAGQQALKYAMPWLKANAPQIAQTFMSIGLGGQ